MFFALKVKHSYPDEAGHVDKSEEEIMTQWVDLQEKSNNKSAKLTEAERLQSFLLKAKELVG